MYIELPTEDPASISGNMDGKLDKALYGTRDGPHLGLDEVNRTLDGHRRRDEFSVHRLLL